MSLPTLTKNGGKIVVFIVFLSFLFWGGFVGYFLIKTREFTSFEKAPTDTQTYKLHPQTYSFKQNYQNNISVSPTVYAQPTIAPVEWKEFSSEKSSFSFKYPDWMQLSNENQEKNSWNLSHSDIPLIDITITNLTVQDARQQNPKLNFVEYQDGKLSGWKTDIIGKDNSFLRRLYILKYKDNTIWILAYLSNIANQSTEPEKVVAEIIQSILE
jgi:hypothetical protein